MRSTLSSFLLLLGNRVFLVLFDVLGMAKKKFRSDRMVWLTVIPQTIWTVFQTVATKAADKICNERHGLFSHQGSSSVPGSHGPSSSPCVIPS